MKKNKLIKVKEHKGNMSIVSVNRNHAEYVRCARAYARACMKQPCASYGCIEVSAHVLRCDAFRACHSYRAFVAWDTQAVADARRAQAPRQPRKKKPAQKKKKPAPRRDGALGLLACGAWLGARLVFILKCGTTLAIATGKWTPPTVTELLKPAAQMVPLFDEEGEANPELLEKGERMGCRLCKCTRVRVAASLPAR